ncbi:MAG TPA: DUF6152 family protein [Vicinamibacterales bacterium]|jgi:hypothetical protein|nr:DUF6152 family protein [Vicinamibacterales bacterium]
MRKLFVLGAGLVLAAVPVMAHHAFGGEFDPNKPVLLKGKVVKLEWVNPHAWLHVEITKPDGPQACQFTPNTKCEEWMVEGGTPNTLLRRGITKESLVAGTELVIDGYQARDHSLLRANGRNITYPDGRKLFLGSSGTGAPTDGADPTEAPKGRGRGGK